MQLRKFKNHPIDELIHWLSRLDACGFAVKWVRTQPDFVSAILNCPRWDWIDWMIDRIFSRTSDGESLSRITELRLKLADAHSAAIGEARQGWLSGKIDYAEHSRRMTDAYEEAFTAFKASLVAEFIDQESTQD